MHQARPRPIICNQLSLRKQALLSRLSNSGKVLVTPLVEDEFSQMSEPECRSFVLGVEKSLRKLIALVT